MSLPSGHYYCRACGGHGWNTDCINGEPEMVQCGECFGSGAVPVTMNDFGFQEICVHKNGSEIDDFHLNLLNQIKSQGEKVKKEDFDFYSHVLGTEIKEALYLESGHLLIVLDDVQVIFTKTF